MKIRIHMVGHPEWDTIETVKTLQEAVNRGYERWDLLLNHRVFARSFWIYELDGSEEKLVYKS